MLPLVRGTIDTHVAAAVVVVAVTGRIRTGDIEENITAGTCLCHTRLRVRVGSGLLAAGRYAHPQPAGQSRCRDHTESGHGTKRSIRGDARAIGSRGYFSIPSDRGGAIGDPLNEICAGKGSGQIRAKIYAKA